MEQFKVYFSDDYFKDVRRVTFVIENYYTFDYSDIFKGSSFSTDGLVETSKKLIYGGKYEYAILNEFLYEASPMLIYQEFMKMPAELYGKYPGFLEWWRKILTKELNMTVHHAPVDYKPKFASGGLIAGPYNPAATVDASPMPEGISSLPGLNEIVKLPCNTHDWNTTLDRAIMHLNDVDRWTREQIADWLDTLDIDLRFGEKNEQD